jgi:hypothetical protein
LDLEPLLILVDYIFAVLIDDDEVPELLVNALSLPETLLISAFRRLPQQPILLSVYLYRHVLYDSYLLDPIEEAGGLLCVLEVQAHQPLHQEFQIHRVQEIEVVAELLQELLPKGVEDLRVVVPALGEGGDDRAEFEGPQLGERSRLLWTQEEQLVEVDLCEWKRGTRKDEERLLQVRCREVAQVVLDLLSVKVQEIFIPFLGIFLDK